MYRQTPSTNQRSREIKVKRVWKICLFLGVCFWLMYQVKPCHDEKKGFYESDVKGSVAGGLSNSFVKLGRKGIHSLMEEMTVEDVEENEHEEDGLEDIKDQEKERGGMAGGDETFDAEVDQENFVDREREGEEGDENENEEKDSEDIHDQIEKESSVEETDYDGDDTSSHEVREEHFKADASSAVSHEIQMEGEIENELDEYSHEQIDNILEHGFEENTSEETDEGEKRKESEVEVGEMVKDDAESNVTYNETEENMWSTHHSEMSESESEYATEIFTEDTSAEDLNLQNTDLEKANYSTLNVDNNHLKPESTDPDETKNLDEIQQDSTDSYDSSYFSEEKDTEAVSTDHDTLPDIQTEGANSEDED